MFTLRLAARMLVLPLKRTLGFAQHHRVDKQSIAINKIMVHKHVHQRTAAVNHNVLTVLLLECGDFFHDVDVDQGRVVPLRLVQGR